MYRIMLADDEGIVIDSLKFIIESGYPGQFEIETAKSGRSVIELAERFRPDIAFMDIQMPGINGIEAMREIKRNNPSIIFIVVSAYDRFMYAKEAITLGVMEYINKPFTKQGISEVLDKAIRQIDQRREQHRNDLIIKEKMENVIPVIENGFIFSILFREYFEEDIIRYKELLEINTANCYMMAFVFGDTQEGNYMTNAVGSSIKAAEDYHLICEIIKETLNCFVGNIMSNKIPVCVPTDASSMDYEERVELIDTCRALSTRLHKETGVSFRVGIGGIVPFIDAMESYQGAIKALINSTGRIGHVDDMPVGCDYEEDYPIAIEKKIFDELKDGHLNECVQACRDFFEWMQQTYSGDMNNIRLKCLEFVLKAESEAYLSGGMTYRFESRENYLPMVMEAGSHEEIQKWFLDRMGEACHNVLVKRGEKTNDIVESAKKYIDENYNKDISLDDISRVMNISPYYFSKLFKEKTGENYVEFLTGLRIDKAKEMLKIPDKSMKEICSEVGYSDPNYFSRIFKKVVGVPPTEYRETVKV
ncbi:MAG: response regulator [Lachnospiraceae bacterium]|nr:response regulator [Lachnospiraceae bacterium]